MTAPRLDFPPAVPELFADVVSLRALSEDDIPAWFERASDAESAALAGDPVPESIDVGFRWLETHRKRFREQTAIRWTIVPNGSTASAGSIGLAITSKEERTAELAVVIARAFWGKGIGTCAARLVIDYAFNTLGLAEIRAELLQSNIASRRLLEKLGFQLRCAIPDFELSATGSEDGYLYVIEERLRGGCRG